MSPLAVVVRNDDEDASLLDDGGGGGGGSPVLLAAGVSPPRRPPPSPSPPLHGKQATRNAVMRCIRSPLAAVLRMTSTCKRTDDAISPSDKRPTKNTAARKAAVERRRREPTGRRTSLEQLLRMEAAPPSRRPDHKSKPALTSELLSTTCAAAVKEKRAHEPPLSPYKIHSTVAAVVSNDERQHATVAVPDDAVKLDAAAGGRRTSAERLVVVLASLRACSRSPGRMPKGPNGKVAAAGRAPGKAELFYYRPIPMGRRCRVQHLEESPYK
ncbi:unnamed protein product [Urochloa humidicola]